jgi:hypothetical protein
LRGVAKVSKHHLMRAAACNLGIIMLTLFGVGTPRTLQGTLGLVFAAILWLLWRRSSLHGRSYASGKIHGSQASPTPPTAYAPFFPCSMAFSTGC